METTSENAQPYGLSILEAAEELGVSSRTLRRRIYDTQSETGVRDTGAFRLKGEAVAFRLAPGAQGDEYRLFVGTREAPPPPQRPRSVSRSERVSTRLEALERKVAAITRILEALEEDVTALKHPTGAAVTSEKVRQEPPDRARMSDLTDVIVSAALAAAEESDDERPKVARTARRRKSEP